MTFCLNTKIIGPTNPENIKNAVILLHGYGGDGQDISLLTLNWQRFLPNTIFLCPDGHQKCKINPSGYQWFDLSIDDEKYIGKYGTLPPDMFTSMSRERTATIADTVSQSTEPGVTVVPFVASSQEEPQQQTVTPGGTTIGGSAPSFPTSNSDNIYTLGAYSTFNVVPN